MGHHGLNHRNTRGDVIQLAYGEDGLDGAHVETQTVAILNQVSTQICKYMHISHKPAKYFNM